MKKKLVFSVASRLRVHSVVRSSVFANFKQSLSRSTRARVTSYFVHHHRRRRRRGLRSHFNYQSINSRGNYSGFPLWIYLISLSLNRSHAQQSRNIYIHNMACFSFWFFLLPMTCIQFWHSPKHTHTHITLWQFQSWKKAMAHEESQGKSQPWIYVELKPAKCVFACAYQNKSPTEISCQAQFLFSSSMLCRHLTESNQPFGHDHILKYHY